MKTQYPAGTGEQIVNQWLASQGMQPFAYQTQAWQAIQQGASGMVNAPTGCGKTFSVFLGAVIQYINAHPASWQKAKNGGLQLLWISPLRALAKDLGRAMQEALQSLGLPWQVGIRNGDTDTAERSRQKRRMPEVLIITPESLHLLLATREHRNYFTNLRLVAVDEWHELVGSKRGVMTELALAWLQYLSSTRGTLLQVWGISATIGNLEQAAEVLLASSPAPAHLRVMIRANMNKQTAVHTIIPDEIEKYPWAGHLGIKLIEKVLPIIEQSNTTLIFINTRGMAELWYQRLLDVAPQLAGAIALPHGSIEQELRLWVEEALHTQKLKAVVATASLDLGVDFRPVDTVIQVGSPKGVSRFLQRAGRAGHQPGQVSHIYFLPTHSLELVESAALQQAMQLGLMESREPIALCYDVLAQFMCTLACGEGFIADQLLRVAQSTWCFEQLTADDFYEVLHHVTEGGHALKQYDEYRKVEFVEGRYRITSRKLAYRHRLHIGAIVSDAMMRVKFMTGGYVGVIEEWFISRLEPGDVFTLAGRNLELVTIKDMTVVVKKSNAKKSIVPSWMGGRMSLTAKLGMVLRQTIEQAAQMQQTVTPAHAPVELQALRPLFALQQQLSAIPLANQLLIEHHLSKEGYHLVVFPFEGRQVHEAMSALVAWRISQLTPITFSIAMNDYGFELLSDKPIPLDDTNAHELFSLQNLLADIQRSTNHAEMAMRKF
ncbi:MAG TPA: ligase-associated DNA damage response DEXH box helicase, partial [Phnomibacter sp.]|nr:ligase-associated DNA damage response DEXH box helicase [Phnomibacter sp.]